MNAEKRQQAIRRMKELSGILKEASRAYYAEDREIDEQSGNMMHCMMNW